MTTTVSTTQDTLYTGDTSNLTTLFQECPLPADAFFLAEHVPAQTIASRQDLLHFTRVGELNRALDLASYTNGRVFCPEFELRWQQNRDTGSTRLIYTGPAGEWPDLLAHYTVVPLTAGIVFSRYQPRSYYLFGESLQQERLSEMSLEEEEAHWYYAEVRIPRLLRYPRLADHLRKRRVQLNVYEYLDPKTESVNWFRFQDLKVAE